MMRKYGKTPSGGDYSEICYFDSNGNNTDDESKAVRAIIRECTNDGRLIKETIGVIGDRKSDGKR